MFGLAAPFFSHSQYQETIEIYDSLFVAFYKNGQIKETGHLNKNAKSGVWLSYYPNGILKIKENYKNGILHGQKLVYYEK